MSKKKDGKGGAAAKTTKKPTTTKKKVSLNAPSKSPMKRDTPNAKTKPDKNAKKPAPIGGEEDWARRSVRKRRRIMIMDALSISIYYQA